MFLVNRIKKNYRCLDSSQPEIDHYHQIMSKTDSLIKMRSTKLIIDSFKNYSLTIRTFLNENVFDLIISSYEPLNG